MKPTDAARTATSRAARPNRRLVSRGLAPAAVLAGAFGASTAAGASGSPPVVTSAKVGGLGRVLVASHRPLYEMANSPKGRASCTGACTDFWKPLIVSRNASHHLGHVSGLGTIHRSNKLQVAIHGHALYLFAGDHSQSQAGGQGFANNWFTVKSNGTLNRTKSAGTSVTVPSTAPPAPTSVPSTTTPPTSPPRPASPPPTAPPPPPPPPLTTTTAPPTTTTTGNSGGGGVGF